MEMYNEFAIVITLFLVSALTDAEHTKYDRHLLLEGKNITSAVVSTSKGIMAAECVRPCVDSNTCQSFFYNTVTGECQYHDAIFTTSAGATNHAGLQYYYNTEGQKRVCPLEYGFQMVRDGGPCVKFHTDMKTWYDASKACVSYSPYCHLVILDNKEKNELIKMEAVAISETFTSGVWIGLSEKAQDTYIWVSGQGVGFTDWGSVDQNNNKTEDCARLLREDDWKWSQGECEWTHHYICEADIDID